MKIYGNYYKMFKGYGGIPQKITIVNIDGDTVTYVRGHYSKEELTDPYSAMPIKNQCKTEKIILKMSAKQKAILDEQDKKFDRIVRKAEEKLEKFKNSK